MCTFVVLDLGDEVHCYSTWFNLHSKIQPLLGVKIKQGKIVI